MKNKVSTHSRPKAAGNVGATVPSSCGFQHTAARRRLASTSRSSVTDSPVSTHSRPKAAGFGEGYCCRTDPFQHTAARRRLELPRNNAPALNLFQHTAARRRLAARRRNPAPSLRVSTHSRPKAAGNHRADALNFNLFQHTAARRRLGTVLNLLILLMGFNTQPPEGGWARFL